MSDALNGAEGTQEQSAPNDPPAATTTEAPAVETGEAKTEAKTDPEPTRQQHMMPTWRLGQEKAKWRAEKDRLERELADARRAPVATPPAGTAASLTPEQQWLQESLNPVFQHVAQPINQVQQRLDQMERFLAVQAQAVEQREIDSFWGSQKDVPDSVKGEIEERVAYHQQSGTLGPGVSPVAARELALKVWKGEQFDVVKAQQQAAARAAATQVAQANRVAAAEGAPSAPKAAAQDLSSLSSAQIAKLWLSGG